MKLYSWNIWFRNKQFDRAFDYIRTLDFDVLCLQEVPEDFLKRLETLPYAVCSAPEVDRLLNGVRTTQYVVILSKHPIERSDSFPLPYWEKNMPLRGRIFVAGMVYFGHWSWGVGNRHALYADISLPEGIIRVCNLHLALAFPRERAEEFDVSMQHAEHESIVAGDFNIVESPRVSILNWLLGGTLGDALLWKRERRGFEKRINAYGLQNPLRGKITHSISRSQLDHILVPVSAHVLRVEASKQSYGSDHRPVFVSLEQRTGVDFRVLETSF